MLTVNFLDFLKLYSQDVLIVAFLVAIVTAIIDKFLTNKQKMIVKMLTPFVLGIMIFFTLNAIKGIIQFDIDTIYAGVLSGSLSSGIFAFIDRLLNNKSANVDFLTLSIEGLINGYVNKEFITQSAIKIKEELNKKNDKENTINNIKSIINKNKIDSITEKEICLLANILFDTVKNLNLC